METNQQSTIQNPNSDEGSLARSVIYKFLSYAYRYPDEANQKCLHDLWKGADSALSEFQSLYLLLQTLRKNFNDSSRTQIEDEYIALFGHSAQGNCPLFEIEYGEIGEDIQKPHELSDIAAFYRAAGLKRSDRSHERVDFVATEMEFMNFLFFKQAYAEDNNNNRLIEDCRGLQRRFLQDHLARWMPAFTRRIMRYSTDGFYGVLARLTLQFIVKNCAELGVEPGSEKLRIRVSIDAVEDCLDCSPPKNVTI